MRSLDNTNFRIDILKTVLLKTLKENHTAHIAAYKASMVAYRAKAIEELRKHIAKFEKGDAKADCNFYKLDRPSNHQGDYKMAIEMIELHQGDTFSLDSQQYRALIKNQWNWSASFNDSVNVYCPELSTDFLEDED